MFKENLGSTIESAGSVIDHSRFSSFEKIIVSIKNIRNNLDDEGPFQAFEREIEKKK